MKYKKVILLSLSIMLSLAGYFYYTKHTKFQGQNKIVITQSELDALSKETKIMGLKLSNNKIYKDNEEIGFRDVRGLWYTLWTMSNYIVANKYIAIANPDPSYKPTQFSKDNINWLIVEISTRDIKHKDKLLKMLRNWKDGDFSNAIDEHNYLWNYIKDDYGIADAINTESIQMYKEKGKIETQN